jgi:hypothetical protein
LRLMLDAWFRHAWLMLDAWCLMLDASCFMLHASCSCFMLMLHAFHAHVSCFDASCLMLDAWCLMLDAFDADAWCSIIQIQPRLRPRLRLQVPRLSAPVPGSCAFALCPLLFQVFRPLRPGLPSVPVCVPCPGPSSTLLQSQVPVPQAQVPGLCSAQPCVFQALSSSLRFLCCVHSPPGPVWPCVMIQLCVSRFCAFAHAPGSSPCPIYMLHATCHMPHATCHTLHCHYAIDMPHATCHAGWCHYAYMPHAAMRHMPLPLIIDKPLHYATCCWCRWLRHDCHMPRPCATCHMPHATCRYATCHAICRYATCHMPHATCHMPHATCRHVHMPRCHAPCHTPHATCHATCHYALCHMRYDMLHATCYIHMQATLMLHMLYKLTCYMLHATCYMLHYIKLFATCTCYIKLHVMLHATYYMYHALCTQVTHNINILHTMHHATNYKLQTTNYKPQTTNYKLQTINYKP